MRLDSMPNHVKLCHGDFNPSNVIVRPDGTMTILDWAHATQGNASGDAAITYLKFAPGKSEAGGPVSGPLLQEERHCPAVRSEVDAHCGGCPADQGVPGKKGLPDVLDRRDGFPIKSSSLFPFNSQTRVAACGTLPPLILGGNQAWLESWQRKSVSIWLAKNAP